MSYLNRKIKGISTIISNKKEKLIIDDGEFLEILKKAVELRLINDVDKLIIEESLGKEVVKKIFKIFFITQSAGGVLTWTVIGGGIGEIIPKILNGTISLQEAVASYTALIYYSKIVASMLVPYMIWRNDKVKNKIVKSMVNGIPVVGTWAFPLVALSSHKEFFKFWNIYSKIKKSYRRTVEESSDASASVDFFKNKLSKACKDKFNYE